MHKDDWKKDHLESKWTAKYQKDNEVNLESATKAYEQAAELYGISQYEQNINPHLMLKFDEHKNWKQNLQPLLDNLTGKNKEKYIKDGYIDFTKLVKED